MKKAVYTSLWVLAAACLVAAPAWGGLKVEYAGEPVALSAGKTNLLVVGETALLKAGTKLKSAKIECTVEGGAVKLVGPLGGPDEVPSCSFQAVSAGKAVITAKTMLFGKGWPAMKTKVQARVMALDDLPDVKIADLERDPGPYMGRVFRLIGMSRGWGPPVKAQEVGGRRMTKSDWVLEDDTGAVNVTGSIILNVEPVVVVAELYQLEGRWGVRSRQVYVVEQPKPGDPKDYVDLDPSKLNVLKVGQVGRIVLNLSKSDVPDIKIEGDAVKPVEAPGLDRFYRADKPGDATIKVYIRFFLDLHLAESPEGAPEKPRAVYRIKVVEAK